MQFSGYAGYMILPSEKLIYVNFKKFDGRYAGYWTMFPLSCARVCAQTGHEKSAHKKTWSTYKNTKNVFAHIS